MAALSGATTSALYLTVKPRIRNPEAEAAFSRGLVFSQRRTAEGVTGSIREFKQATELEPGWADAWANLAEAYSAASNAELMDPLSALKQAEVAAKRAIDCDGRPARGHGALAVVRSLDLDQWPTAEAEFRRAIELNPEDPNVLLSYVVHLRKLGRFREAENYLNAADQHSRSPDPKLLAERAFLAFTGRKPDRFKVDVQRAHELFPNEAVIELLMARSLQLEGRFDEAMKKLDYVEQLGLNRATVLVYKASVAAAMKQTNQAIDLATEVERIGQNRPIDGLLLAGVYAQIGKFDKAFETIHRAYQRRDSTLISIATSPFMDYLRSDRRFQDWLERLHFTNQIMHKMEFNSSSANGLFSQPSRIGTS